MKKGLLVVIGVIFIYIFSFAQLQKTFPETPKKEQSEILTAKVIPPAGAVAPGDNFELILELTVSPGYHINSSQPEDEFLVPTSLEFKDLPVLKVKEVIFPPAVKKKFRFSEKMLSVYEGQIKVKVRLELSDDFCGSSLEIEGRVRYQACNDEACLRPLTAPFKINLKIAS